MKLRRALAQMWRDIAAAWRVGAVRQGIAGTALITVGSLSPAYLPSNSPWWRLLGWAHLTGMPAKIGGTVLVVVGLLVLVGAWFQMRPLHGLHPDETSAVYTGVRHWAVLLIWGLPFFGAPPIFSHDAYSYAAQGWLLHNGINPYYAGPGVLPGAFADQVAWVWRFTPAPYGPLSLRISSWLIHLCGYDPYWSALAQRIPALVGVGLIGLLLPRIASRIGEDPAFAAWFGVLNPLVVIDFIGGAHNDALMMGLVITGIWVAAQPGPAAHPWIGRYATWIAGAAVIGLAASIKQPALLAAYPLAFLKHPWRDYSRRETTLAVCRATVSVGTAVGTFALISLATGLGFGWFNAVDVPGKVVTVSPATVLGQGVQFLLDVVHLDPSRHLAVTIFRTLGVTISIALIAWWAVTIVRHRPMKFLSYSYLAFALGAPALHSWYMLWGGLLLPLAGPKWRLVRASVWATVVLLCYAAINLSWRNGALALGVAALVGFWWQSNRHDRTARAVRARTKEEA